MTSTANGIIQYFLAIEMVRLFVRAALDRYSAWQDTDELVRKVRHQTSLSFDHEQRDLDVWFMVDDKGEVVPPQWLAGIK
jgi:hypothetical protein